MNLSELLNNLHINYIGVLKKTAIKYNLSLSQLLCIISVPYTGIQQTILSKKLCLDLSTLSRNLDKLILKKIIKKSESIADKRSSIIELTDFGEQLYENISVDLEEILMGLNQSLDYTQIEPMINAINSINWYLSKKNQLSNE